MGQQPGEDGEKHVPSVDERSQTGFTPQFEVALPPTNNPTTATGAANALGSHLAIAIPIRTNSPATSGP